MSRPGRVSVLAGVSAVEWSSGEANPLVGCSLRSAGRAEQSCNSAPATGRSTPDWRDGRQGRSSLRRSVGGVSGRLVGARPGQPPWAGNHALWADVGELRSAAPAHHRVGAPPASHGAVAGDPRLPWFLTTERLTYRSSSPRSAQAPAAVPVEHHPCAPVTRQSWRSKSGKGGDD